MQRTNLKPLVQRSADVLILEHERNERLAAE
eukprot:SAG31_NODE_8609_length_1420_cov_1.138531_2_plen_30_part_01